MGVLVAPLPVLHRRAQGRELDPAGGVRPRAAVHGLQQRGAAAVQVPERAQGRGQRHPQLDVARGVGRGQQPECRLVPAAPPPRVRARRRHRRPPAAARSRPRLPRRPTARRGGRARPGPAPRAASASATRPWAASRHPPRVDSYTAWRTSGWRKTNCRGTWVGRTRSSSSRSSSAARPVLLRQLRRRRGQVGLERLARHRGAVQHRAGRPRAATRSRRPAAQTPRRARPRRPFPSPAPAEAAGRRPASLARASCSR